MAIYNVIAPWRSRLRAWVRHHALLLGTLLAVVTLTAACTGTASAHEADQGDGGEAAQQIDRNGERGDRDRDGQRDNDGRGGEKNHDHDVIGQNGQDGPGNQDNQDDQDAEGDGPVVNGNQTLGQDCSQSDLQLHDGFVSDGPRCVEISAGEHASFDQGPQLLITDSPRSVEAGEGFTYTVSTRNLVRDRFLGAADGGYYVESSFLNEEGLQRGHFHTGCRMLSDGTGAAPDPTVEVDFFVAVEDSGGGTEPDQVEIEVSDGLPQAGLAQCAAWAGDGSHRIPMMAGAQQIPAFDTFLLEVQ